MSLREICKLTRSNMVGARIESRSSRSITDFFTIFDDVIKQTKEKWPNIRIIIHLRHTCFQIFASFTTLEPSESEEEDDDDDDDDEEEEETESSQTQSIGPHTKKPGRGYRSFRAELGQKTEKTRVHIQLAYFPYYWSCRFGK